MALHRWEAGIVKRSEGKNVIARAAYNARERLVDERTNQVYDYRHLGEAEWKGILNPDQAPDWITDREKLWNAVEKGEDRSNHRDKAQLARDFKIALPEELNAEQRLALTKDYAAEMVRKGMVVDVAIHAPHADNDDRNYHFHMLATMRSIGPDGFGNKVRSWNQKAEFHRWKEKWSELGADHLERAGFQKEADRFRDGHLSRRERARRAHERGDIDHFERLLNEPERHRGPAASAMEKAGKRTHQGDINREIQARNRMGGIAREIREAYYLSVDQPAFAVALDKKDIIVARVTQREANSRAIDRRYTNSALLDLNPGELVAVTERGHEYRLGPRTLGDSARNIGEFMKALEGKDCLSLEEAHAEAKKRSLVPKVDRDAVIEKMTSPWKKIENVAVSDLPPSVRAHYEEREVTSIDLIVREPKDHPRAALPYGANMPHVTGAAGKVWWAYNSVDSPEAFQKSLTERGFHLARVTAEDAQNSRTDYWLAKQFGQYRPKLSEGEYLAVSEFGYIYRLNDRSLGHDLREIRAFLGHLDGTPVPSLRDALNNVREKRQREITERPGPRLPKDMAPRTISPGARIGSAVTKIASAGFEFISNGIEALFTRRVSAEDMAVIEAKKREDQIAAEQERRQRGGLDRGR